MLDPRLTGLTAGKAALFALALALPIGLGAMETGANQDVVILKDGQRKTGKIERETDNAIFLELEPGEVLPIGRERIERIERAGERKELDEHAQEANPKQQPSVPLPDPMDLAQKPETQRIYETLKDLGHKQRDRREEAMKHALDEGFRAVPVLLAICNPKQGASPELCIGALRALAQLGPLDAQAAKTLGWVALKALHKEVFREACHTIRVLKEDRALQWILGFATSQHKSDQMAAARALREINDDRAFAALAFAVPAPSVNANVPDSGTSVREIPNMPLGGNLRGPLFLPSREIQGTAENIMSPEAEALTMIAGKNLGGLPSVWGNWINEKIGAWTMQERLENARNHGGSLINRMGSPQAQGGD